MMSPASTRGSDWATTALSPTQSTAGTRVTKPIANGRATRRRRWLSNDRSPRRRHSMAVKKPLNRKNTGIRNPCTAHRNSS